MLISRTLREVFFAVTSNNNCINNTQNTALKNDFRLAPNPAHDFCTLYFDKNNARNVNISVTNTFGRCVFLQKNVAVRDEMLQIPVETWQNGIYFVKIENERGGISIGKMIKM